jgi:hypothetical protein
MSSPPPLPDLDMSGFLTPERLYSLGSTPRLSRMVGHLFHIANTLIYSLELPTSLLQASFISKLSRRDLRLTLE